jgi:hypothetical protein
MADILNPFTGKLAMPPEDKRHAMSLDGIKFADTGTLGAPAAYLTVTRGDGECRLARGQEF